jgi:eukaryotic-like serine/threonine-protein kinase
MKISATTWNTVSKLLDEALDLEPVARTGWLERLQATEPLLASSVQQLLAAHATSETADILAALPPIEDLTATSAEHKGDLGLSAGDRVGPYLLKRELGAGGMADVWLAERADGAFARNVALKIPRISRLRRDLAIRFARERDILARLEHPHIARLYDAGVTDDRLPYLAMEFVDGQRITDYCDHHHTPIKARLELFAQVLDAVQFAHANLIIHRDLKPSNILVGNDGRVRLLDFGIAKLLADAEHIAETQLTQLSGRALTPDYASPEQIKGEPLTTASDVYSLGVVLYELLTGVRPYRLKLATPAQLEQAIIDSEPTLPSLRILQEARKENRDDAIRRAKAVAGDLDTITMKALQKNTGSRYISAGDLALELKRHLTFEPIKAKRQSGWYAFQKFVRRNQFAVTAACIVILSLSAGLVGTIWQAKRAEQAALLAKSEANKAKAVQDFLLGIFRANSNEQKDPEKARATTARELLDIGAGRLTDELKDVPEAQSEVLHTLGQMYYELGLKVRAADMQRKRIDVERRLSGSNPTQLIKALLQYADTLSDGPAPEALKATLDEVRNLLSLDTSANPELRAVLLTGESVYFLRFSLSKMKAAIEEAMEIAAVPGAVDQRGEVDILRWAVLANLHAGDASKAESLASLALEKVEKFTSGQEAWQVQLLQAQAKARLAQLRIDEAERDFRRAVKVSREINGSTHLETTDATIELSSMLGRTARTLEAAQMLEALRTAISNPEAKSADHTLNYLTQNSAIVDLERGLADKAFQQSDQVSKFLDTKHAGPATRAKPGRIRAEALVALGRPEEAAAQMQIVLAQVDEFFGKAAHPSAWNPFLLTAAKAQAGLGNNRAAMEFIEKMQAPITERTTPFTPDLLNATLLRANILLREGNLEGAAKLASAVVDKVSSATQKQYFVSILADATFLLGEVEFAKGSGGACELLRDALKMRKLIDDPTSARLSKIAAQVKGCKRSK